MIRISRYALYNPDFLFEDQENSVRAYIENQASMYQRANMGLSAYEGTGEPGQPIRFTSLVVDNHGTVEGTGQRAMVRSTYSWQYPNPYGHEAAFSATAHGITNIEVIYPD